MVTETYAYDPLRRLVDVSDSEGFQATYEYDVAGNRTRWQANDDQTTQTPWDDFDRTYDYDDADRLLRAGDTHYTYDANGNRVNANWPGPPGPNTQGVDYTYDLEDRLTVAQAYQTNHQGHRVDREVTRLFYDGQGLRLAKEYDPKDGGGGVKRTEYVYDGLDPIVEYALWNGQREEFYRSEGAQLLTMRHFPAGTQGQSYWYHHDGRGSVAGVTKHLGQSTHNYRYDAYGQLLPARGNWTDPHNHYTFSGKEWDENLRLYEFGARLYDPWAGLWLTADPVRGEPQRPRTLHKYAYAFASPISYYDRYGLQSGGPPTPMPPTPGPPDPTQEQQGSTRSPSGATPQICLAEGSDSRRLSAIGWRIEGTVGLLLGGDVNLDFLLNLHNIGIVFRDGEIGISGLQFNVSVAPGGQIATEGGGISTGPLFIFNLPENEALEGWGWRVGGTVYEEAGMEVEVFGPLPIEKGGPVGVYVGFGVGVEFSGYLGGAYTLDITEEFMGLLERIMDLTEENG